ncbi:MAG: HNH endonuclease [Enterobacter cloacae]|nr:HNH endonuclease [Enterobacter cloacae]
MKLAKTSYSGVSLGQHFQEANESLLKAMENDSAFAEQLNKLGIKPERTPTGIAPRRLPEGWIWQHEIEEGTMRLVPRSQYTPGSGYWKIFHLDGYGGYAV